MATAKKREVTKTRMVEETYIETDGVVLTLSNEEAALLTAILYTRVTGSGPLRKIADGINNALASSGMSSLDNRLTLETIEKLEGYVNIKRGVHI